MAITRINHFQARTDKAEALRDFLRSIIALVEGATGCRSCTLLADQQDPTRFVIVEVWDNVTAHQASVGRIPPGKLQEVQPLLAEPPQGRYYDPI
jgi:quinol monooxygenase YgiN